jgi:ABC-type uncharacterized transport system substrate-binding protein
MTHEQVGGVIVLVDAALQNSRTRVTSLAARHRLPAAYGLGEYAVGGLLAYGPNRLDMFRHAATYVDQILKGAKPGDLPVEQPNKFALIINLKTAKTLGLTRRDHPLMDRRAFTAVVVRSSWLPSLTGEAQQVPLISRLAYDQAWSYLLVDEFRHSPVSRF